MKTYSVYILKCADNSHYTSITCNLSKRLDEHQLGKRNYTRDRRPVQLAFYAEFPDISTAVSSELEIKSWPYAQKEILIKKGYSAPPNPAKRSLEVGVEG